MVGVIALAVAAIVLVAISLVTARRPVAAIPDFDGYLKRWRPLHGDYDPHRNAWLLGWLRMSFWLARPLARRGISPDVLTIWGIWLAFAVFVPAAAGGYWPMLAGWTLVASGLFDTLDGCVAVLTDRATRWGALLDALVDRICDVIYLAAIVSVGAPIELALAAGIAFFLLEYVRARAANLGADRAIITLGERANRVAFCSAGIHFGGVFVTRADLIATLALAALTTFSVLGFAQLLIGLRRQLLAPEPTPTAPAAAAHARRVA